MSRLAEHLGMLTGWRRAALAVVAGAVSVLSMAPVFFSAVLFVTFPILIWLLDGCGVTAKACAKPSHARLAGRPVVCAALTGWFFGFGFFLAGLYWVGAAFLVEAERFGWLLPLAVSLLPAGLALFFAAAAALAHCLWRPGAARLVALALALMAGEWLRGHIFTGFPWNTLGYALTTGENIMQAASVFGIYGLTPIAVVIFSSPAAVWAAPAMRAANWTARLAPPVITVLVITGATLWGVWRINSAPYETVPDVALRLVQPNIAQTEKWKPENRASVFETLMRVSTSGQGGGENGISGVTHLMWPESSVPFLLADTGEALRALSKLLPPGTSFIVGAARAETDYGPAGEIQGRRVYNSIFVMDHGGRILSIYDKNRLVPFGEFLPLQNLLEAIGLEQLTRLRGGFAAGDEHRLMRVPGAPRFSPLICYEIIFPDWVRPPGAEPGWLLNLTNDAWFGLTSGPHQHFHQARMRAVEQGLPVVRVANSGISGVIDPYGRTVAKLALNTQGVIDSHLPKALSKTLYAAWGFAIEAAVFVAFGLIWLVLDQWRCLKSIPKQ